MRLSIVILTMNRKEQVCEAIKSCLCCMRPKDTEFIVVDNASTDGTETAVRDLLDKKGETYTYKYLSENRGVGGGRNVGFDLARGKFIYFLDDDAIISENSRNLFFVTTIQKMEEKPKIASLTTKIYDEIFGESRNSLVSKTSLDNLPLIPMYLGGSHFLRKECFCSPLYFNIPYGNEEYAPSIYALDEGYYHVYDSSIAIVHKPKVNKWAEGSKKMAEILKRGIAVAYATKIILYPNIFRPLLWLAYLCRCKKHLSGYAGAKKETDKIVRDFIKNNKGRKVKFSTVIKMYKNFGLTVF